MKSIDKVQNIIENSGNDFHLWVANFLRERGWEVKTSPYYNDLVTNKSREIDIVALKKYEVSDRFSEGLGSFALRLFVECKYIKDANVIWFEKKDMEAARELARDNSILSGLDDHYLQNVSIIPHEIHHYVQENEVMKLGAKSGNADPLYEAMSGCLSATVFYTEHRYVGTPNTIDFPLIAVDSFKNLHRRDAGYADGYRDISDNFQLEVDYSFPDKQGRSATKYFLLDIVSKDKVQDFLELLDKNDIQILRNQLARKARQEIFDRARMARSDDNQFDSDV